MIDGSGDDDAEDLNDVPTAAQIAEACNGVLDPEVCDEIAGMEDEKALKYAFACLPDVGIEDPELFFMKKGILINGKGDGEG